MNSALVICMKPLKVLLISLIMLIMLTTLPHVVAQTEERFEYSHEGDSTVVADIHDIEWYGQTFIPQISHTLSKVVVYGQRIADPAGNLTVSIRETDVDGKPIGGDLTSKSILSSSISTELTYIELVFDTQITLNKDTKYAIVFRCLEGNQLNSLYLYGIDLYPQGRLSYSDDSGVNWQKYEAEFWFEEWGYAPATPSMGNTLFPFLPILGLVLGLSFAILFFMVIAYVSNRQLALPYEMIFVPLFCVIAVGVSLIIIVIFGL